LARTTVNFALLGVAVLSFGMALSTPKRTKLVLGIVAALWVAIATSAAVA
jgi:hypothetical protein